MDKKNNERVILNMVYNTDEYAEIVDSEHPDFLIRHKNISSHFGVEITEFYYSESNARIRNIPNYLDAIINHNRHRHKIDRNTLQAADFTVKSPDGTPKGSVRGIIQKSPTPEQYAHMVADAITVKNAKFREYDTNLGHVNLIVFDTECRLRSIPVNDFYDYFYNAKLKSALYSSVYREIFLITALGINRRVFIPLMMLLLLADLYIFGEILKSYTAEPAKDSALCKLLKGDSALEFMLMFEKYIRGKTNKARSSKSSGHKEVILGNSGIILDEGKINLIDHYDYPYPKDTEMIEDDEITAYFSSTEFRKKEKEILARYTFCTELAFDVKGD